jgi:hypothetical protein
MANDLDIFNKRFLYIGYIAFNYDRYLIKKITELGGIVDSFNINLDDIYFNILIKTKTKSLVESYKNHYYRKLLNMKNYDFVLVRHGYQLDAELIKELRHVNPSAKFINFHWDSLKRTYNYLPILNCFDKVYSFDYKDSEEHSSVTYLPLFYLDEYVEHKIGSNKKDVDMMFIGAWRNPERYELIKKTQELCQAKNLNFYYYLHSPFKHQFYYFKDHGIFQKDAKAHRLSHGEILKKFVRTRSVIDFPSSFQTGLTMRCYETLAAGLKLITTNANIKKEPFFNPELIQIIDADNIEIDLDFIKQTSNIPIRELLKDYSLERYLQKLLQ